MTPTPQELNPCPFCGGMALIGKDNDPYTEGYYLYYIYCGVCRAQTVEHHGHQDDAFARIDNMKERWNTRCAEPVDAGELDNVLGFLSEELKLPKYIKIRRAVCLLIEAHRVSINT